MSLPSEKAIARLAGRFRAFSDPARLGMIFSLMESEKSVSDLVSGTGLSQAGVSKHLGVLRESGVVNRRKVGLRTFYSISDESVFRHCELACEAMRSRLAADLSGFESIRKEHHPDPQDPR